jgi:propane monooxygenase coupling protein
VTEKQQYEFDRSRSDRTGVTVSAGVEGNAIADLMSEKEVVEVTKYPAMIRIDNGKILEFDLNEIGEYLGAEDFSAYDFEMEMSTHYGRMVRLDDKVILFANPEDTGEYLGFEPSEDEVADSEDGPTLPA